MTLMFDASSFPVEASPLALAAPLGSEAAAGSPLLYAVAVAVALSFAWQAILSIPLGAVFGVKWARQQLLAARARREAVELRVADGARFTVHIAPLEQDDGVLSEIIGKGLERRLGEFLMGREVAWAPIPLNLHGPGSQKAATIWAERSDADLVVWGRGSRAKRGGLLQVWYVTKRGRLAGQPAQEIRILPPSSAGEADKLAAGAAYLFARAALPAAEEAGKYRPEKLNPVLAALDQLIAAPPKGLGPDFERLLREDASRIALSCGERSGDVNVLRRASRLRARILAEIDQSKAPREWAAARAGLGQVLAALGAAEGEPRRLDSAVEAFAEVAELERASPGGEGRARALLNLARAHHERAKLGDEAKHLDEAARAYRTALKVAPDLDARFEIEAKRGLAGVLHGLAEISGDQSALEQAIDVYKGALDDRARGLDPMGWAAAQHDLGLALAALAARFGEPRRMDEALGAFRCALEVRTKNDAPEAWAETMTQLGHAFYAIGKSEAKTDALEAASWAYDEALTVRTKQNARFEWAQIQNNLGNVHHAVGERASDTKRLKKAVYAYRMALEATDKAEHPFEWAGTQNNLGNALHVLGELDGGPHGVEALEAALAAHRGALSVRTKERARVDWAATRNNMGLVLTTLGERTRSRERFAEAVEAYRDALGVFRIAGAVRYAVLAERNLERAQTLMEETASAVG